MALTEEQTLLKKSQTNWRKATQYCAKATVEQAQPQKSIASIRESNETINLFLDLNSGQKKAS